MSQILNTTNKKVWLYLSDRAFTSLEKSQIEKEMQEFTTNWKAHGTYLAASYSIIHNQILKFSVDEDVFSASGCSIDASVHFIKQLENKYKLSLTDHGRVAILVDKQIVVFPYQELKMKIEEGEIKSSTLVFDFSLSMEHDWQSRGLLPAEESWIKRYFKRKGTF